MHNNRNNCETVIISQTIIVPTKSIIVASLPPIQIISLEVFVHRIGFNTTTLNIKEYYQSL